MSNRLALTSERIKAILTRNSPAVRARRRVITKFAEKLGFVYFGAVDQHVDDHRIVRGFSVSHSHMDSNYVVGTYEGVNITLVDRFDLVPAPSQAIEKHRWLIMEFELEAIEDVPHVFLLPTHQSGVHYQKVFNAFATLEAATNLTHYSAEFVNRYGIYSSAAAADTITDIITPEVAQVIAAHFWPLGVEIFQGSVYIYDVEKTISEHSLETALKNGTWLSQVLVPTTSK